MTSARLPGKVLKTVMGRPLLEYELERLRKVGPLDELIVATTLNESDDAVAGLCERLRIPVYRGSEHDVLSRFYEAAKLFGADVVVRFTADCPLIDPELVSNILRAFADESGRLDYMGIDHEAIPRGTDAEVFSFGALERANREGLGALDREHVTWFIHQNPDKFSVKEYSIREKWGKYRFTVDTKEDFGLVKEVIEALYPKNPNFSLSDMIAFLDENPEVRAINKDTRQKQYV
jgi:spore coat polysaccharide biosynthesis protein SpsF